MGPHRSQEQIDAYLDNELHGGDRDDLVAHCDSCETCRARLESRRTLLRVIRAARPQYQAPESLRSSVAAILNNEGPRRSFLSKWRARLLSRVWHLPLRPRLAYAWLLPILISAGLVLYLSQRQARADHLVDMAIETHRRQVINSASVEFRSSSAREVTRWCSSRLPFAFRLPTYQDDSGDRSKYELTGASLVRFRGKDAAYVAYRMGSKQISLIVVSADEALASGGSITKAKSLIFHEFERDGLQIFTWSVHHVTYALVSDEGGPNRQSCVVCHSNPRDHSWQQSRLAHHAISRCQDRVAAVSERSALQGLH